MAPPRTDTPRRWDLCEDRALLPRFRDGEKAALEQVFRAYLPLVLHLVVRGVMLETGGRAFVTDTAVQDDLVQDVFLRLFEPAARARYDGLRPYAALVRTVTRNVVVDHLRKHGKDTGRLVALPETDLEALSEPEGGGPEQSLLDGEEAAPAQRSFTAVLKYARTVRAWLPAALNPLKTVPRWLLAF
jgi:DNA-directed RNA polymerase specialized sigma24 family protein